jgi:hypothetical protein
MMLPTMLMKRRSKPKRLINADDGDNDDDDAQRMVNAYPRQFIRINTFDANHVSIARRWKITICPAAEFLEPGLS